MSYPFGWFRYRALMVGIDFWKEHGHSQLFRKINKYCLFHNFLVSSPQFYRRKKNNYCKSKKILCWIKVTENTFKKLYFASFQKTVIDFLICCFAFKPRSYMTHSTESCTRSKSWPLTVKQIRARPQISLFFLLLIVLSAGLGFLSWNSKNPRN